MPEENPVPVQTPSLVPTIPSVPPIETKKSSRNKWLIGVGIIVLSIVVLIGYCTYKVFFPIPDEKSAQVNNKQPTIGKPIPASEALIKKIPIKIGYDTEIAVDDSINLVTAQGHYLIQSIDTLTQKGLNIIYDGKVVSSAKNNNLADTSRDLGLSENGLHYTYIISYTDKVDLFIDGKKVTSASKIASPTVTNDGKTYYYTNFSPNISAATIIFKNDSKIFETKSDGEYIDRYSISSDGQSYVVISKNTKVPWNNKVYVNGSEVFSESDNGDQINALWNYGLSANGYHSALVTQYMPSGNLPLDESANALVEKQFNEGKKGMKIFIDGVLLKNTRQIDILQVTNDGNSVSKIYTVDKKDQYLINDKAYEVCSCSPGRRINTRLYINSDASIILKYTAEKTWKLNDTIVDIGSTNGGVEIVGKTVFVYQLIP